MAGVTIGKMDKRVTFQTVDKTADNSEGRDEDFTTLLSTWAFVSDSGGSRNFLSGSDKVYDSKNIYVQSRQALLTALAGDYKNDIRIQYDSVDYSIDRWSKVDEKKRLIKFEVTGSR